MDPDPIDDPSMDGDHDVVVGGEHDLGRLPPKLWFHPSAGGFAADGPVHDAAVDPNGFLWVNGHYPNGAVCSSPLGVATSSVTVDRYAYDPTVRFTKINNNGELLVARQNFIEKFSNNFFGVQQSWTFPFRPTVPGSLTVRVAVAGQQFVGSTPQGLQFEPQGDFGTTYGHATWIDAGGNQTYVPAKFIDGKIVLQVPSDVVANSTYPAVLDPQIDVNETPVDQPVSNVPTGANTSNPAVASDGLNYLAVWRDDRNGTDSDIFGMILSTGGSYSTANGFVISKTAGGAIAPGVQSNPTVAFVNGSYLVVWQDFKSPAADADLVAARVSTTGTVTILGSIASTSAQETAPRIAVRGTQALVVFQSGSGVAGRLYDGANFAGGAFSIAATGSEPAAGADPAGNYLVTYTDAASTTLFGQFVTSGGGVDPTQHIISDGAGAQELSSVEFAGGSYIVVWQNNRNGRRVFGARFDATGATTDTHTEVVSGVTTTHNGVGLGTSALVQAGAVPGLVCGSSNCTVTWSDRRNFATGGQDVFALQFAFDLTGQTEISVSTAAGDQKQPKIALAPNAPVAGGRLIVIWEDLRNGAPTQITASRIDGTTVLDGGLLAIVVSVGANSETNAAITRVSGNNQNWLIAWSDSRGTTGTDIQGTRVSDSLSIATLNNAVSNAPGHQGMPAAAAANAANGHLVVWTDGRTNDIRGSRVSTAGAVADTGDGLAISTFVNDQQRPAVASNGNNHYLVVWQDRGQGVAAGSTTRGFDIYGAVVDASTGAILASEIPISTADGDQQAPAVTFDQVAQQFVVVWQDGRAGAGERDLFAARVTDLGATSAVIESAGVQVSAATGSQLTPRIAFGSDRSLAVWEDRRSSVAKIFGARLRITGAVAGLGGTLVVDDPSGIGITSAAAGSQQRPSVAFVSTTEFAPAGTSIAVGAFAVVWDDNRSNTNLDIFGNVIFQSDGNLGSEFPIAISTDNEAAPAIGPGGPAQADGSVRMLVTYSRLNSAISAQRVVMRRVTFGSQSFNCETTTCQQSCNNQNTSCDVNCSGSQFCTTTCNNQSACNVNCEDTGVGFASPNSCTTTCNNGSTCNVDCRGAAHCVATCNGGNNGSSTCDINCNDSGTGDCGTSTTFPITCGKNDLCTIRCVPGPAGAANTDADCGFFSCVQGTVVDCNFIPLAASPQGAREVGTTATYKTTAAHGFVVGQSVIVSGVATAGFNGTFTIATVPTTTTFTVTGMPTGLGNSGGGHVSPSTSTGAKVCHAACPASN